MPHPGKVCKGAPLLLSLEASLMILVTSHYLYDTVGKILAATRLAHISCVVTGKRPSGPFPSHHTSPCEAPQALRDRERAFPNGTLYYEAIILPLLVYHKHKRFLVAEERVLPYTGEKYC